MNKSNYYYRKLAQACIFSELGWEDIVDLENPHENIYSSEFLDVLTKMILEYKEKDCLEKADIHSLQILLSDLRFLYPYQSKTEKETIFETLNHMIRMSNDMSGKCAEKFFREEIQKRYELFKDHSMSLDLEIREYYLDPRTIRDDLSQDVYLLMILFSELKDLPEEQLEINILNPFVLSTINAMMVEAKHLLTPTIQRRLLELLQLNVQRLETERYGNIIETNLFEKKNQLVLKRLKNF